MTGQRWVTVLFTVTFMTGMPITVMASTVMLALIGTTLLGLIRWNAARQSI